MTFWSKFEVKYSEFLWRVFIFSTMIACVDYNKCFNSPISHLVNGQGHIYIKPVYGRESHISFFDREHSNLTQ